MEVSSGQRQIALGLAHQIMQLLHVFGERIDRAMTERPDESTRGMTGRRTIVLGGPFATCGQFRVLHAPRC